MKMRVFLMLSLACGLIDSAVASSDGYDRVYIVAQNQNDTDKFFVERVPVVGCYGELYGPRLQQFTRPYMATANIGCEGEEPIQENINYLVCAKVTGKTANHSGTSLRSLDLDISGCDAKEDIGFLTALKEAARRNFPSKGFQLNLSKGN
jgi:hypothetical protein